jgi:hypothetical protein
MSGLMPKNGGVIVKDELFRSAMRQALTDSLSLSSNRQGPAKYHVFLTALRAARNLVGKGLEGNSDDILEKHAKRMLVALEKLSGKLSSELQSEAARLVTMIRAAIATRQARNNTQAASQTAGPSISQDHAAPSGRSLASPASAAAVATPVAPRVSTPQARAAAPTDLPPGVHFNRSYQQAQSTPLPQRREYLGDNTTLGADARSPVDSNQTPHYDPAQAGAEGARIEALSRPGDLAVSRLESNERAVTYAGWAPDPRLQAAQPERGSPRRR